MKISGCTLLLISLASILGAQEPNRYGSVGLAAVVPTAEVKDQTVRLATQVLDALRKDGNLTVRGEVQSISEMTDGRVIEVAQSLAVDWLTLVRFDPKDQVHAVFTVELIHIVAQKVASRAVALFGFIRTSQAAVLADLATAASRSKDALTALITRGKAQFERIWVVLNLLTDPPEADFVFGASSNRTNKDGVGRWEGTLPPGSVKLRVLKQPDYAEKVLDIVVPDAPCSPCYLPYQRVQLTKTK